MHIFHWHTLWHLINSSYKSWTLLSKPATWRRQQTTIVTRWMNSPACGMAEVSDVEARGSSWPVSWSCTQTSWSRASAASQSSRSQATHARTYMHTSHSMATYGCTTIPTTLDAAVFAFFNGLKTNLTVLYLFHITKWICFYPFSFFQPIFPLKSNSVHAFYEAIHKYLTDWAIDNRYTVSKVRMCRHGLWPRLNAGSCLWRTAPLQSSSSTCGAI